MLTKKGINQMGSRLNESAGSKVSAFALKHMEKFGWKEGKGLGKDETGIVKHIKAVKKEENTGIGRDAVAQEEANTEWWHDAFSNGLKKVHKNKKTKQSKKKRKDNEEDDSDTNDRNAPTFEALFAATGGARLGMRARARQPGKLLRTEQQPLGTVSKGTAAHISNNQSIVVVDAQLDGKKEEGEPKLSEHPLSSVSGDEEGAVPKSDKKKKKKRSRAEVGDEVEAVEEEFIARAAKKERKEKKEKKEKKRSKENTH